MHRRQDAVVAVAENLIEVAARSSSTPWPTNNVSERIAGEDRCRAASTHSGIEHDRRALVGGAISGLRRARGGRGRS